MYKRQPDEQGYSAPGNLCCKQRDRSSPVLCAERAGAYVPAQPEMLERAETVSYTHLDVYKRQNQGFFTSKCPYSQENRLRKNALIF